MADEKLKACPHGCKNPKRADGMFTEKGLPGHLAMTHGEKRNGGTKEGASKEQGGGSGQQQHGGGAGKSDVDRFIFG